VAADFGIRAGQRVRVGNGVTVYRVQEVVERGTPAGTRRVANLGPIPGTAGSVQIHIPLHEITIVHDDSDEGVKAPRPGFDSRASHDQEPTRSALA